jgi:hypothetical protein
MNAQVENETEIAMGMKMKVVWGVTKLDEKMGKPRSCCFGRDEDERSTE